MNVLSLFDGMSCGQLALNAAGIEYKNYFASEIKSHAIKVTQSNYPKTIQLGSILGVTTDSLPKIDLLIGGSPCQDFSRGNRERLGVDGIKSGLFFQYVRLLNECSPKYFLLENVVMEPDQASFITSLVGVSAVRINSSLVSGQLRDRMYWTNIPGFGNDFFGKFIEQPKDKRITLQSVLSNGFTDREKARCLLESDSRPLRTPSKMWHRYYNTGFTTIVFEDESLDWKKGIRYLNQAELETLQTVPPGYTKLLNRNEAACLLGDGWTVDVIAHIFKGLK